MKRALVSLLALAACAGSTAELRGPVDREVARRLGDADAKLDSADQARIQAGIDARLAQPLDVTAAVRIALANNARVRAALAEIGIAGSGLAITLGPTTLEIDYRGSDDVEVAVLQDILALVAAPRSRAAARADVAAARANATALAVRLAARVELAVHDLIAAQAQLEQRRLAFDAADAAALVRERMHAAGAASDLAQARERDAREQARIELGRAEAAVEVRREAINALLGLSGSRTQWTLAGELPALPASAPQLDAIETTAVAASLELASARARSDAAANHAAEQRLRSVLPHLGVGVATHTDGDTTSVGPAIAIGIPLLDWNSAGRGRANAEQQRAAHELTAIAVELRAHARAARVTALSAYAEARHYRDVVLPLRQQILDETVKHYNAMDAEPFALIAARRALADGHHDYIDALRRYANAIATVRALERGVSLSEEP